MSYTFLVIAPADPLTVDVLAALAADEFAPVSWVRWRVFLIEQDDEVYTPHAAGRVVADLGIVYAEDRDTGDPSWTDLLPRVEVAGFDTDHSPVFYDRLGVGGMWLWAAYAAPTRAGQEPAGVAGLA